MSKLDFGKDEIEHLGSNHGFWSTHENHIHRPNLARFIEQTPGYKKADVAASFQEAVVDVLLMKSLAACKETGIDNLVIAGGVAANSRLRQLAQQRCEQAKINLSIPPIGLCTDNGAMVAALGSMAITQGVMPSQIGIGADSAASIAQVIW